MKKLIENQRFSQERALYGSRDLILRKVSFDGEEDGESALKESENIEGEELYCNLRYPFWHVSHLRITDSELTPLCRAALWYCRDVAVQNTRMLGIKALRESEHAEIENCTIVSPEFGWYCNDVEMRSTEAESEYFMLRSRKLNFKNVKLKGKYSFQYIQDSRFENCSFDTKDAFWHAENVIVENSFIKGEYLGWYSRGLTLINCTIIGTQPLCYCKELKLIHCKMLDADLSFERSEVDAEIVTPVKSIKNPYAGRILVPSVQEVIRDDENAKAEVLLTPERI